VRCHAKDHARSTCKEPVGRWEAKFDENKDKYWAGTLKWQQKAQEEKKGTPKVTPPPTLVQQPKPRRRHHLAPRYQEEEDERIPLQCRAQLMDDNGSEDDLPPLRIDPTLPVDTIDLLARASTGMNDVFIQRRAATLRHVRRCVPLPCPADPPSCLWYWPHRPEQRRESWPILCPGLKPTGEQWRGILSQ
jgi:hypothetical protein